ncbi:MAG: hypothetical protein AAFR52_07980 [Pseudomonadota bacterium]
MVLALIFLAAGFAIGWVRTARRGGHTGDKVQMGFAHAIPAALLGFAISILLVNLGA